MVVCGSGVIFKQQCHLGRAQGPRIGWEWTLVDVYVRGCVDGYMNQGLRIKEGGQVFAGACLFN